MSIWDTTESRKCPNCGGNVIFDANLSKSICKSCGNLYDPQSFEQAGVLDIRDTGEASEEEEKKAEFVCDNCGARVVTDENTAATFCAFCGSPSIIRRRLDREFRPDFIIPFKITKEQALENFKAYTLTGENVPKNFIKTIDIKKITGIYVPFWLLNADCHTDVVGSGVIIADNLKTVFNIDRTIHFKVKNVPFDGSQKISNMLMESIEPFDFDDLEYYNDMYIPGFYAQRYDESALDMTERIKSRLDGHARQLGKFFTAKDYQSCSVSSEGSVSSNFSQSYALMPIWFIRCKFKNINYTFAINGQTGKVGGSLPYDETKRNVKNALFKFGLPALWFALTATVLVLGLKFLFNGQAGSGMILLFFMLFIWFPVAILFPKYRAKVFEMQYSGTNSIAPPPEVEEFIDLKQKIEMEKRDSLGFMTPVVEDEEAGTPYYMRSASRYK